MVYQQQQDLLIGDPVKEIVEFAKRKDVDLIVMGSHGLTGIIRVLMGSVAEAVVRRSPCPVLTYREPAQPADEPADE